MKFKAKLLLLVSLQVLAHTTFAEGFFPEGLDPQDNAFQPRATPGPDGSAPEKPVTDDPAAAQHSEQQVGKLSPVTGTADTLNSKTYVDLSAKALNSQLGLLNMTWNLTEPGVAQGLHNAISQANQGLELNYLEMQLAHTRAQESPDAMAAYQARRAKEEIGIAQGKPWIKAVSVANGGSRTEGQRDLSVTQTTQEAKLSDQSAYPADPILGTPGQDKNTLYATDYIFNQEINKLWRSGGGIAGPSGQLQDLLKIRLAIKQFVGDGVWHKDQANAGIIFDVVDPIPPTNLTSTVDASHWNYDKAQYEFFSRQYIQLHELLGTYCYWFTRECAAGSCSAHGGSSKEQLIAAQYPTTTLSGVTGNLPGSSVLDIWKDSRRAQQFLTDLSVPGFALKPEAIEAIFDLYKQDEGKFEAKQEVDGALSAQCDELNARVGHPSSLDVVKDKMTPRISVVMALAKLSARGNYLATLARAEYYIKKYSFDADQGGFQGLDAQARDFLLKRIRVAAKLGEKESLDSALESNAKEMKDFVQQMLDNKRFDLERAAAINNETLGRAADTGGNTQTGVSK